MRRNARTAPRIPVRLTSSCSWPRQLLRHSIHQISPKSLGSCRPSPAGRTRARATAAASATSSTSRRRRPRARSARNRPTRPRSSSCPRAPAAYHEATGQTVYRCNCTTCTKLGFWHLRLADAPGDFYVFAPARGRRRRVPGRRRRGRLGRVPLRAAQGEPVGVLQGVRGPAVRVPRRVERARRRRRGRAGGGAAGGGGGGGGGLGGNGGAVAVWSPRREGWQEGSGNPSYISVNLTSVDAKQEGFDLRDFSTVPVDSLLRSAERQPSGGRRSVCGRHVLALSCL